MVMNVSLSPVLLCLVAMRRMHVVDPGMVVLVGMGGEQVPPVLATMKVMRDVEVLVAMHEGLVPMMALRSLRHSAPLCRLPI